jgi:hypothetical protein
MTTALEFVKDTIYQLKREYPLKLDVYRIESAATNVETGKQTTVRTVRRINTAILLPTNLVRTFTYDLAFISANKNFTVGGFYDLSNRVILIDKADLDIELTLDDYFGIRGKRYDIKQVEFLEELATFMVAAVEIKGAPLNAIYQNRCTSILDFASVAGGVK